ncbi:putative ATPase/DNA-binding SARP family transcriptional activator [Streptosporangium becharense]|uniref:Putative ATPase n=1 Tax=Streptosporangium becharense TaxID=1816182 RepID=A0A7W9MJ05_9ACTN|nr:BTAD domain-containing putative transcriptional regulator [Streptosporangium becharense]MBB2911617.1 putative ATPase/DNA-binding SARP family transcriptional activator [Streptosporangium becharense]MBB5822565.1 putative ATPase [Streptosporangium becharense]
MRFDILGPTRIRRGDGGEIPPGGPGMRALLVLLLLDAGKVVTAERLVTGLYGADAPAGVANALQSRVSRLRRVLGVRDVVEYHPAGYRLAADPGAVDAHRFERLAAGGRRALAAGEHGRAAALLEEALGLWRGPALADVGDAPFAPAASARLEELRLDCVEDRVQAGLELGRHRELVAELRELAAAHPLRERLHAQLMRALYGAGRQAEALEVYRRARRVLGEELGVDPSAELTAVHLAMLRADPALGVTRTGPVPGTLLPPPAPGPDPTGFAAAAPGAGSGEGPVPASGAGSGENPGSAGPLTAPVPDTGLSGPAECAGPARLGLRAQLTSFVGREDEMSRLRALLGRARLVTLVGPGGAGKTRLAGEVAAGDRADVCFAELAPVADGAEAAQTVLGALGVRDAGLLPPPEPGRPVPSPLARLTAALHGRPMLLVLDNCEHLVAEVAHLADRLLAACPRLRILATSREALGITGEAIHPVGPLPVPPAGTAAEEAATVPAVRLFADRASAVRPGFGVDEANVGQVLDVCRALDGLPLALELAAARLRSLPLAEVASRLGDRFRLLSRGSRTALPRHQTLRAVVAWSWDLLDDAERLLAARLTVFAGGATPGAAARVCGLPEAEAVDLLSSLAEKSLVEQVGGRYRMLETIRAYCAERLAERGETEERREAHGAYYADLVAEADPALRGAGQLEWLRRLDEEGDDLHAALRWAAATGRAALGLRLVAGLAMYWWVRGRRSEGAGLAADLLGAIGPAPVEGLEEEYAMCVLVASSGERRSPEPPAPPETVAPLVPPIGRPHRYPLLAMMWSMFTGPASVSPEEIGPGPAGERWDGVTDPWLRALLRFGYGFLLQHRGDAVAAERAFGEALGLFRAVGERWGSALTLMELADCADLRDDRAASRALAGEALRLAEELGSVEDIAELVHRRARWAVRDGDLETARAEYLLTAEHARRAGAPEILAKAHRGLGEVARLRGDLAEALAHARRALEVCPLEWYTAEETRLRVTVDLGRIAASGGDVAAARARYGEVLVPALSRYPSVAGAAVEGLAEAALLEGDTAGAARLLGAAVALSGAAVPRGTAPPAAHPATHPDVVRVAEAARARLGADAYEEEWLTGARLSRDEVAALLGL